MTSPEEIVSFTKGTPKGTVAILIDGKLSKKQLECIIWNMGFEEEAYTSARDKVEKIYRSGETSLTVRGKDSPSFKDFYKGMCDYSIYMRRNNFVNSLPKDAIYFAKKLSKLTQFLTRVRVFKNFPGDRPIYDSST